MGAIFALRGYRTQFLYTLHKILINYENEYTFYPEGEFEDLDIFDSNNNCIEVIQIKNKSGILSFSDLTTKTSSFFRRALKACANSTNTTVNIVSFGKVSEELRDKTKLTLKLKNNGFSDDDISKVLRNYRVDTVDEKALVNCILELLKQFSVFSDPNVALELLLYWLYLASEKQQSIISRDIVLKLERIGKFTTEQKAFNTQFGNSILPFSTKSTENDDLSVYKEGFYYGISAKFEHILADLDVRRYEKLELVNKAFCDANIVFIHGASGQGKSTLAYRYINDYTQNATSYELKVSQNLNEVYETINSLEALSKGLSFPILLYIDIRPQDFYWNDILKELHGRKNLKFLITIRQEDWNRTTLGTDYKFSDIELTFNRYEAEVIYESLSAFKKDLKFVNFEESWSEFQCGGMLLEYVYLINQGDTLRNRLKQQLQKIEEKVAREKTDELEILRYVCLSDVFNSKINYPLLCQKLNLRTPKLYIEYFEKEYLLKYSTDKNYITGLHPIRSKLICEILYGEYSYVNLNDYILTSLEMIDEKDLHLYLLESFSKGLEIFECIDKLKEIKFKSWTGYAGAFRALIWKGMFDFIFVHNIKPIQELSAECKEYWNYNLPFNFATDGDEGMYGFFKDYYSAEKKNAIEKIHRNFTEKSVVYNYLENYLEDVSKIDAEVLSIIDFRSLGEINFWVHTLNLEIQTTVHVEELLTKLDDRLPLEDFSVLLFGLQLNSNNRLNTQILKKNFIDRLRLENNIIHLKESDKIECKYFYDAVEKDEKSEKGGDYFNIKSMTIIDLLQHAFPNKEIYSISGVGISFFDLEMPYDPTKKEISSKNLPNKLLVANNALIGNIYNFQFRPVDWNDYVTRTIENRHKYLELTSALIKKFAEYFATNDIEKFVNNLIVLKTQAQEIKSVPLPKNISDKWGYLSDGSDVNTFTENTITFLTENVSALRRYSKIRQYGNSYFNAINGFFNSIDSQVVNVVKMKLSLNEGDYNANATFMNLKTALKDCSAYHNEFELLFNKFYDQEKITALNTNENKNLEILFICWHQLNFKKGKLNSKIVQQSNIIFAVVKNDIGKRLLAERKKMRKETGFEFNIYLSPEIRKTLILTSEITSDEFLYSLLAARTFLQKTINTNYTSIKSIYIESNIQEAIFIPLFNGNPINKGAVQIMTYNLDKDIDEAGFCFNSAYLIPDEITKFLKFEFWNDLIPEITYYEQILSNLTALKELRNQYSVIRNSQTIDRFGQAILENYYEKLKVFIETNFSDSSRLLIKLKSDFDENIYTDLERILGASEIFGNTEDDILNNVCQKLDLDYRPYAEKLIRKMQ